MSLLKQALYQTPRNVGSGSLTKWGGRKGWYWGLDFKQRFRSLALTLWFTGHWTLALTLDSIAQSALYSLQLQYNFNCKVWTGLIESHHKGKSYSRGWLEMVEPCILQVQPDKASFLLPYRIETFGLTSGHHLNRARWWERKTCSQGSPLNGGKSQFEKQSKAKGHYQTTHQCSKSKGLSICGEGQYFYKKIKGFILFQTQTYGEKQIWKGSELRKILSCILHL